MELLGTQTQPEAAGLQAQLERHARLVETVLREAAAIAHVSIVTLAQRAWLDEAPECHLPGLDFANLLAELGVTVYHAQDDGERLPAALRWGDWASLKQAAMDRCLGDWYAEGALGLGGPGVARTSVISVGDSNWERLALKGLLADTIPVSSDQAAPLWSAWTPAGAGRPWCKTVKLMCGPSLEDLSHELCSLPPLLRDVVLCDEDFDLCVDSPSELAAGAFVSV